MNVLIKIIIKILIKPKIVLYIDQDQGINWNIYHDLNQNYSHAQTPEKITYIYMGENLLKEAKNPSKRFKHLEHYSSVECVQLS